MDVFWLDGLVPRDPSPDGVQSRGLSSKPLVLIFVVAGPHIILYRKNHKINQYVKWRNEVPYLQTYVPTWGPFGTWISCWCCPTAPPCSRLSCSSKNCCVFRRMCFSSVGKLGTTRGKFSLEKSHMPWSRIRLSLLFRLIFH